MRIVSVSLFLSVCLAVLIALMSHPDPIDAQLLQLQLNERLPGHADRLKKEPPEVQALFIDYADDPILVGKARLALLRYPTMAQRILLLFGTEELFQEILKEYGDQALPAIHYFLENESLLLTAQTHAGALSAKAKQSWTATWKPADEAKRPPSQPSNEVSAEERGWYAITQIKVDGHGFLGQFVLDEKGHVQRVQTERALEALSAFVAGGVRDLETKWQRGERVDAGDVGWAAADLAIGVTAVKALRMGRTTVKGTRAMGFSKRNAALGSSLLRGSAIGLRVVKYGAPAVLAYIAIRHPSVLNSIFREVAEALGVSVQLLQIGGWTLVLFPIAFVGMTLLRPLVFVLNAVAGSLRWLEKQTRSKPGEKPA